MVTAPATAVRRARALWSVSGALDTSIVIRTLVAAAGRLYFSAGGGIVADSDPDRETEETRWKALGLVQAAR